MSRFKSAMSYGRAPPKMLPMTHIINHAADFKRGVLQCRFQARESEITELEHLPITKKDQEAPKFQFLATCQG